MTVIKGYKVCDAKRQRTVGLASRTLVELVEKGKSKLNIPKNKHVAVFLSDGTEVDSEEYFKSLPSQTVLLLKQDHEDILTGADLIYNALKSVNIELLCAGDKVKHFLDENIKEKVRLLADSISGKKITENKTFLSNKSDDPDWFFGLETNATTKEAFMFRRSQERIRGYLYKTKTDIKKSSPYLTNDQLRRVLDNVFFEFSTALSKDRFFGCFFDRSADGALCNPQGEFKCSGVWRSKQCSYNGGSSHVINPYASREARIVFSTWNLDHCIERSRSIMPALVSAAECVMSRDAECAAVNVPYFYSLLFTRHNLRLVHIVCHDKGKHHSAQCDPNKFTIHISSKSQDNSPSKIHLSQQSAVSC